MKFDSAWILGEPPFTFLVKIVPRTIVANEKDWASTIFPNKSFQKTEEGVGIEHFCKLECELCLIETYGAVDVGGLSLAVGINSGLTPNS